MPPYVRKAIEGPGGGGGGEGEAAEGPLSQRTWEILGLGELWMCSAVCGLGAVVSLPPRPVLCLPCPPQVLPFALWSANSGISGKAVPHSHPTNPIHPPHPTPPYPTHPTPPTDPSEPLPEPLAKLDPQLIENVCSEVMDSGGQLGEGLGLGAGRGWGGGGHAGS